MENPLKKRVSEVVNSLFNHERRAKQLDAARRSFRKKKTIELSAK